MPRVAKFKIPIVEGYSGYYIVVYEHGYNCQKIFSRPWIREEQVKYYQVALKPIKTDEEYNKNLHKLIESLPFNDYKWYEILIYRSESRKYSKYSDYDLQFIVEEHKMFFNRYSKSRFLQDVHLSLARFYELELKNYQSAIVEYETFLKNYPNSVGYRSVKEDVERLKRLIKEEKQN